MSNLNLFLFKIITSCFIPRSFSKKSIPTFSKGPLKALKYHSKFTLEPSVPALDKLGGNVLKPKCLLTEDISSPGWKTPSFEPSRTNQTDLEECPINLLPPYTPIPFSLYSPSIPYAEGCYLRTGWCWSAGSGAASTTNTSAAPPAPLSWHLRDFTSKISAPWLGFDVLGLGCAELTAKLSTTCSSSHCLVYTPTLHFLSPPHLHSWN